jgi:hypothetical protein
MIPMLRPTVHAAASPSRRWNIALLIIMLLSGQSLGWPSVCRGDHYTLFLWNHGDGGESQDAAEKLAEPLVTDRPDFTEASSTVGLGVVQLEAGYTYSYDADNLASAVGHSYPETLLRIGVLAEWLEARIAWNYASGTATVFNEGRETASGAEDLYLGFKWALTGQAGIMPEMAIITQMTVPTGSDAFTAGETLPGVSWLYGWDLNDWISTGGSTQVNRAIDSVSDQPYAEFAQSWTIGYSLSDRVGAYTEWFAFCPDGADFDHNQNYANAGLTFLVNDNLQLDVRAGVGLNEAADDLFTGAGFAWRL